MGEFRLAKGGGGRKKICLDGMYRDKKRAGFLIESAHIQKNPPLINGVLFIFLVTVVLSYFVPKKQLFDTYSTNPENFLFTFYLNLSNT